MLTWRHFREIAHNTVLESRGSDGPDLLVLLWVSFRSQKRGPKGLPNLHYRLTLCARHVTPLIRQNKKNVEIKTSEVTKIEKISILPIFSLFVPQTRFSG